MRNKMAAGVLAAAAVGIGAGLWLIRRPLTVVSAIWLAGNAAPSTLAVHQRERLVALVEFARARSAYYHALYRDMPAEIGDLSTLPIATKPDLMAHFAEWVTDPTVTRSGVEEFAADLSLIGKRHLDRYAVWTTSGTTGKPGIFVHDLHALSVYSALVPLRAYRWITSALLWPLLRHGRVAVLVATEGHFALADWFERTRNQLPPLWRLRDRIRVWSVLTPLAKLVQDLNDFQPSLLLGYPSIMKLLGLEQRAGRLRIAPTFIGTGGESLDPGARTHIVEAFHCILRDNYGASEFPYIAFECDHGWLHVNSDWVLLEPVDAAYQPVPPGQPSHTVLLTNLVNRVQPLIRYDLGDSIIVKLEPCGCGSSLPAIRVEGRKADILYLRTPSGNNVAVLPLALGTVIEETRGIRRAQVIQTGPATLTLRLELTEDAATPAPEDVWEQVEQRLRRFLAAQGIPSVVIIRAPEVPQGNPISGKFRQVWSEVRNDAAPPGIGGPVT